MNNADKPINPQIKSNRNNANQLFEVFTNVNNSGLTKREYFAGLAMQGLLASFTEKASNGMWGTEVQETAKSAIDYADALLKQLETTQRLTSKPKIMDREILKTMREVRDESIYANNNIPEKRESPLAVIAKKNISDKKKMNLMKKQNKFTAEAFAIANIIHTRQSLQVPRQKIPIAMVYHNVMMPHFIEGILEDNLNKIKYQ